VWLFGWQRGGRQLVDVRFAPPHDCDMIHIQMVGNPPEDHPVSVHFHCLVTQRLWIAICFQLWHVASQTKAATIALTAGVILVVFDLFSRCLTG
jgi:hypothetical protein